MSVKFNNANVAAKQPTLATWIAPTLLNAWVNFGAPYNTAGYYKDSMNIVHIRGLIKSGTVTAATALFNLPVGYRPLSGFLFPGVSLSGSTIVSFALEVASNGDVLIGGAAAAGNSWLGLDVIQFRCEQ